MFVQTEHATGLEYLVERATVRCRGDWTLDGIARLEKELALANWPEGERWEIDGSAVERLDTAGAWLLQRTLARLQEQGKICVLSGFSPQQLKLLEIVGQHAAAVAATLPLAEASALARLGRATWEKLYQVFEFLVFVGESALATLHALLFPARIRWRALFANLETAGLYALPIVGLMSFLIGIVLAYQGGSQLRLYGANIFIADLVGITLLRELAPMLTAIMVAGRTGSAFTAQIATMKITDEIDALRTLGIAPMELLVVPKLLALLIALPLLTVFADIMGLLGAMLVAKLSLEVSFAEFLGRLQAPIMLQNYLIGIGKTPIFAVIVVLIGCFQGFRVSGGADSVGTQVTLSVVQAIFLVIVADAVFSILFSGLGL